METIIFKSEGGYKRVIYNAGSWKYLVQHKIPGGWVVGHVCFDRTAAIGWASI